MEAIVVLVVITGIILWFAFHSDKQDSAHLTGDWAGTMITGETVTYWRYKGHNPMWGNGRIWVWGWQMRSSNEWEQVTKAEFDQQQAAK